MRLQKRRRGAGNVALPKEERGKVHVQGKMYVTHARVDFRTTPLTARVTPEKKYPSLATGGVADFHSRQKVMADPMKWRTWKSRPEFGVSGP